jgi:branched-subunit amino acid aminotransferase/4-amino-4-deoxychorismate lyase
MTRAAVGGVGAAKAAANYAASLRASNAAVARGLTVPCCTEVFACGTAAILSPIGLLTDRDQQDQT